MKNFLPLILILGIAQTASAQEVVHPFAKGTQIVGFSLNAFTQEYEMNGSALETSRGILNGRFGLFIIDGLALGIDLQSIFTNSSEINSEVGNSTDETVQHTIGIFTAYYIRLGSNSAIYPEIRIFAGRQRNLNDADFKQDISGSSIGIGYAYRISPYVGMNFTLSTIKESETTQSTVTKGSGGQFLGGFQIFF